MSKNLDYSKKIWRYMDMSGFISIVVNEALYFSSPTEFQDPFEGYLPKGATEATLSIHKNLIDLLGQEIQSNTNENPFANFNHRDSYFRGIETVKKENGISCWHMNDFESEAMWKLYAKKGIAIESTIGQLRNSLPHEVQGKKIHFYPIRYEDFESIEIEKGHEHYMLAIKRKSFEHEREIRASVALSTQDRGVSIRCDLNQLITQIHVSPLAPAHIKNDLEQLLKSLAKPLDKPVSRSTLYDLPNHFKIK